MIAVIILPGPSDRMLGLDAQYPLSLLSLGDRSFLQHLCEYLVAQNITSLEILISHGPNKVEAVLGNGDRWGCRIRYHLISKSEQSLRSLRVISGIRTDAWVLVHAAQFPLVKFDESAEKVQVFCREVERGDGSGFRPGPGLPFHWGGVAVFPAGSWGDCLSPMTLQEVEEELGRLLADTAAVRMQATEWMDVSSPKALLASQAKLLNNALPGIRIGGVERQRGVWISRNVAIHRTAELIAPLYIGPDSRISQNTRLGPETVIAGSCIVDKNSTVEHSLLLAGTYVGTGLELNRTIIDRDLLVNVGLETSINIVERFLLGGLDARPRHNWIISGVRTLAAFLLLVLFLPVSMLSVLYFVLVHRCFPTSIEVANLEGEQNSPLVPRRFPLPCLGEDAWSKHRPAGRVSFVRQFLPGLYAVMLGRMAFVGLPPRRLEEVQRMPSEWRALYHESKAGLITEASIAAQDDDVSQLYLSDAFYVAKQSARHDLNLAIKYFSCLFGFHIQRPLS